MNANRKRSLEELLLANDGEIIGTPSKFANIIFKFESITWNEAQQKAAYLIKASEALNYLQKVRSTLEQGNSTATLQAPPPVQSENPVPPVLVNTPANANESSAALFSENYRLLTTLIPELEQELWGLAENSILLGTSATNIHGDISVSSFDSDKYGYYLKLEINESGKPLQKIGLFINVQENIVMVLFCESNGTRFDVYDDIYTRKMVDLNQLDTQNRFLQRELKQLLEFKLFIPTVNSASTKDIQNEEVQRKQQEINELRKEHETEKTISLADRERLMYQFQLINTLYQNSVENNSFLEEENRLLKDVLKDRQVKNFELLCELIPDLSEYMKLQSFTVLFQSNVPINPRFVMEFQRVESGAHEMVCGIYRLAAKSDEKEHKCDFSIFGENQLVLDYANNFREIAGEMVVIEPDEISEDSIQGTNTLHNFFAHLLKVPFHASVSQRIDTNGVELIEAVEENTNSSGENAALVGIGVLGLFAAVFLGVKLTR